MDNESRPLASCLGRVYRVIVTGALKEGHWFYLDDGTMLVSESLEREAVDLYTLAGMQWHRNPGGPVQDRKG